MIFPDCLQSTKGLICMCLCLTFQQQLRSYVEGGGGAWLKFSSDRLEKPEIGPAIPGLQGEWFIHCTTVASQFV